MLHQLIRKQEVNAPIKKVWDYFATPANLNELTPENMRFKILDKQVGKMYAGQLIAYRIQFMPLIKSRWLTEITHVQEQAYFIDEQRIGPYRLWIHEHRFESTQHGTMITDQVTYALPFGIFGELVHTVWVGKKLKQIFDYRYKKIQTIFGMKE